MKRKGVSFPNSGTSTFSSPGFSDLIGSETKAKYLLVIYELKLYTRAIIFDSANRDANQFLRLSGARDKSAEHRSLDLPRR